MWNLCPIGALHSLDSTVVERVVQGHPVTDFPVQGGCGQVVTRRGLIVCLGRNPARKTHILLGPITSRELKINRGKERLSNRPKNTLRDLVL